MALDILIDENNELPDGDIVLGDGDAQNLEHLILAPPGTFKHAPLAGVGFTPNSRLADPIQTEGVIKKQLRDDKWINEEISITNTDYYVKAQRND